MDGVYFLGVCFEECGYFLPGEVGTGDAGLGFAHGRMGHEFVVESRKGGVNVFGVAKPDEIMNGDDDGGGGEQGDGVVWGMKYVQMVLADLAGPMALFGDGKGGMGEGFLDDLPGERVGDVLLRRRMINDVFMLRARLGQIFDEGGYVTADSWPVD